MFQHHTYDALKQELDAAGVQLIAVSKTFPEEVLELAYQHGCRVFGENKAQELARKHEALPKDICWHFIGHLQTNKVKYIAPFVDTIHAVDSMKLLREIDKQAAKNQRSIRCLLQFHIAREETKFGLDLDEARTILDELKQTPLQHVQLAGVMGMATYTSNEDQIRSEFSQLKAWFDLLKSEYFAESSAFCECSMGMSGDWKLAVECGSTMVRIGSLIFGAREYS
jgi:hypothetical protein